MDNEYNVADILPIEQVQELQAKLAKMVAARRMVQQRAAIKDPLAHAIANLPDVNRYTSPSPVGSRFIGNENEDLMREALKLLRSQGKGSESA